MNEKSASRAVKAGGKSQYRWVMLALVMLVYIIVLGFTNQSFNILLASIVGDEGWTPVQKTAVSGAMSLGMVWFCFVGPDLPPRTSHWLRHLVRYDVPVWRGLRLLSALRHQNGVPLV